MFTARIALASCFSVIVTYNTYERSCKWFRFGEKEADQVFYPVAVLAHVDLQRTHFESAPAR